MSEWCIAADDRTGALEMAAEMVAVIDAPVWVWAGERLPGPGVVDIGTRAMSPARAASRAGALDAAELADTVWSAHKIDSTLRGNWAAELRARQQVVPRPVVLLAAWPAMGRVCRDGVVYLNDAPVAAVRASVPEARRVPPTGLSGLASGDVVWVDIETDDDLVEAADAVAALPALVAGPAGALGAVARCRFGAARRSRPVPDLLDPTLVVCGSATGVSAEQIAVLAATRTDVEIVAAPPAQGSLRHSAVVELAARVRPRLGEFRTVVILGGDTAATVLGDAPRVVGGYAAAGMPWSVAADGGGPVVVTKAGGFGSPDALVHLLQPCPE